MKKLSLDFGVFKEIREADYLYVDKTRHAYNLITQGKYYFLSRPRRFGKSLLISMLKSLLAAHRTLFKGLWIDQSDYAWKKHGVIALDFSAIGIRNAASFNTGICVELQEIADDYHLSIELHKTVPENALRTLVRALQAKFGKTAILIDEYDGPILQALHDTESAQEIRDTMQRFFTAIKGLCEYLDFVFIAGVSSFTKAGLFSGINNLQFITLEKPYETICGYTQEETEDYFNEYLIAWEKQSGLTRNELIAKIKAFYNGYAFGQEAAKVYNPFALMHALDKQRLDNFWIQTGTPSFLIHELEKEYQQNEYNLFDPTTFEASRELLGLFDIDSMPLPALLFQSGYLTITGYDKERDTFSLGYPNIEIRKAMQKYLASVFAHIAPETAEEITSDLESALQQKDIEETVCLLKRLLIHVPYQLHTKEEKFYHAFLPMVFNAYDIPIVAERISDHGCMNFIVELKKLIYIISITFNDTPETALKHIKDIKHCESFIKNNKQTILLGLSFNRSEQHFDITYAYKAL